MRRASISVFTLGEVAEPLGEIAEVGAMPALRVYVVAEFEAARIGLGSIIDAQTDMAKVGEAPTLGAMAASRGFERADVLLVDVKALNRANLDDLKAHFPAWTPTARILFFGSEQDARGVNAQDLPACLAFDAVGFLLMDAPGDRIVGALRLVGQGKFVCECEMEVLRGFLTALEAWAGETAHDDASPLSGRELDVLRLVAQGLSNRGIAEQLFLSEGTVKIHISRIMTKLDLERRTELVRYALARGLVPLTQ
jgi:DNA-binding NarL/FixJ family response regulator